MGKNCLIPLQITQRNNFSQLMGMTDQNDLLKMWLELYFEIEVTTLPSSPKIQRRDLNLFIEFMLQEEGNDKRTLWTPRLAAAFKHFLTIVVNENGKRRWSDKTANRILAHVKTFAKWVNKIAPFPLGNPMGKIRGITVGNSLDVDRALTPSERRRMLDAADRLPITGGRSKDRHRYKDMSNRPVRKKFSPYRNRAIIYTLIETGMRREAVTQIDIHNIDFMSNTILVAEKGRVMHSYSISKEGAMAIRDYMEMERLNDANAWASPALFVGAWPGPGNKKNGRLSPWSINHVWNGILKDAGIETNRTPHSARHAMSKHIIEKTGNLAAVQRQLGHKNAAYSMQYSRVTGDELQNILNDR